MSNFMADFISIPVMEYVEYRSAVYFSKQVFNACEVLCLIPRGFLLLIKPKAGMFCQNEMSPIAVCYVSRKFPSDAKL